MYLHLLTQSAMVKWQNSIHKSNQQKPSHNQHGTLIRSHIFSEGCATFYSILKQPILVPTCKKPWRPSKT